VIPDVLREFARSRVLIVDDNLANAVLAKRILVRAGLTDPHMITDPREVISWVKDNQPDLVLLDLHMPYIDGYALLTELRLSRSLTDLPVIVLTADTQREAAERAFEAGASDFLTKPLDANEVVLRVRNLLEMRTAEERYRLLVDLSTDMITTVSPSTGKVLYASPSVTSMLGWAPEDLVGRQFQELVPDESGPTQPAQVMLAGGQVHVQTLQLRHRDGSLLWCEASSRSIVNPRTGEPEIRSSVRDVSARVAAQEALAASEERFRLIQMHAPIGMALIGLDGRYLQVNPALCRLAGRSEQELLGLTFQDITHPDDLQKDLALFDRLERGEIQGYELEKRYVRPDGVIVWVLLSRSMVRLGSEPQFVTQALDITDRKRNEAALAAAKVEMEDLNQRLAILSVTDSLTGAFNRRHLDATLAATCLDAERHGDLTAVLLIDIDHFKDINDKYGHRRGDEILKAVTNRLASTLRAGDTLARWGGEEFVILLPRTSQHGAAVLAERVRSIVAGEPFADQGDTIPVTVSVGMAVSKTCDPEHLMSRADWALYQAKNGGRNRVKAG
jgi:diguanylate cyclase (GGDEF)-like protein/PAS domain S-box-containing protein